MARVLDDNQVELDALTKELLARPIADLKELIIIKNGKPTRLHP
jgi:hypothetical protein